MLFRIRKMKFFMKRIEFWSHVFVKNYSNRFVGFRLKVQLNESANGTPIRQPKRTGNSNVRIYFLFFILVQFFFFLFNGFIVLISFLFCRANVMAQLVENPMRSMLNVHPLPRRTVVLQWGTLKTG